MLQLDSLGTFFLKPNNENSALQHSRTEDKWAGNLFAFDILIELGHTNAWEFFYVILSRETAVFFCANSKCEFNLLSADERCSVCCVGT